MIPNLIKCIFIHLFSLKRLNITQLSLGLSDEAEEVLILEYLFTFLSLFHLFPVAQLHLQCRV